MNEDILFRPLKPDIYIERGSIMRMNWKSIHSSNTPKIIIAYITPVTITERVGKFVEIIVIIVTIELKLRRISF